MLPEVRPTDPWVGVWRSQLRHGPEVLLQSFLSLSVLLLGCLGFFYPLYVLWPACWMPVTNLLGAPRLLLPGFLLLFQGALAGLWSFHLSERATREKVPLQAIALKALLAAGLGFGLWRSVSAYLPPVGQELLLGLGFWGAVAWQWRPAAPRLLLWPFALLQALLLLAWGHQILRVWWLPISLPLLLCALVPLPLFAGALPDVPQEVPHRRAAYRPLMIWLGLSLLVLSVQVGLQIRDLQRFRRSLNLKLREERSSLFFTHPVLSPPRLPGNAYPAYWALLGRRARGEQSYLQLQADAQAIQAMFIPAYGYLKPNSTLVHQYLPLLQQLRQATHYERVQYPQDYALNDVALPNLELSQQLFFLMNAQGLLLCQTGQCAQGWSWMTDSARFLQDLSAQGVLIPLMVSYRLERLLFSFWGYALTPESLSPEQWQPLLVQWQSLMQSDQGLFEKILNNEILLAQDTAFQFLPVHWRLWQENALPRGLNWLIWAPVVSHNLSELSRLQQLSQTYLQQPVHDLDSLNRIKGHEQALRQLPQSGNVPPVSRALFNYVAHLALTRGFYLHLALQAQARTRGCYPTALVELQRRGTIPLLPHDPYTGRDYRYVLVGPPSAQRYGLYPVGLDQADHGGGGNFHCFRADKVCLSPEVVFVPPHPLPACSSKSPTKTVY